MIDYSQNEVLGARHSLTNIRRLLTRVEIRNGMIHLQPKCPSDAPLSVVPISKAFDQIDKVHAQLCHARYVKTFNHIKERFVGITKKQVQWLVEQCQTCPTNHLNRSRGELKLSISNHILQRVQIHIINMHQESNHQYKWILHLIGHLCKFRLW